MEHVSGKNLRVSVSGDRSHEVMNMETWSRTKNWLKVQDRGPGP